MDSFSVSGARVVVVGAARSGIAAAQLLVRRGARVTLTDQKSTVADAQALGDAGVVLKLGSNDASTVRDADLVVLSPGVPLESPLAAAARDGGVPIIGELEMASRWLRGSIVAITGTKGKSTTTTLVGRMLEAEGRHVLVGGNIGVPLSAQVDASTPETIHVIEASSFQLESTETFHPHVAALLNFSPDHLDHHPSEAAYGAAKARIFANQTSGDFAVINADSDSAQALAAGARARRLTYAIDNTDSAHVFAADEFVWERTGDGRTPLVPLAAIELAGRHMLSNVTAAAAISLAAGASSDAMTRALEGFTGLEHVMEPVATIGQVRFVNDSKATNVDAAARSIETFDRVVVIVGGRYKAGAFEDLAAPLKAHGRGVVAFGESRAMVRRALEGVVPLVEAESMADAVSKAHAMAQPDGVVLLAPACSSFDMFADYADRGRAFKEAVGRVRNEELRTKNEERNSGTQNTERNTGTQNTERNTGTRNTERNGGSHNQERDDHGDRNRTR